MPSITSAKLTITVWCYFDNFDYRQGGVYKRPKPFRKQFIVSSLLSCQILRATKIDNFCDVAKIENPLTNCQKNNRFPRIYFKKLIFLYPPTHVKQFDVCCYLIENYRLVKPLSHWDATSSRWVCESIRQTVASCRETFAWFPKVLACIANS